MLQGIYQLLPQILINFNLKTNSLSTKESSIGLFDVLPQLFNKDSYGKLSIAEKLQLYFTDPSLVPLFIQVNLIY